MKEEMRICSVCGKLHPVSELTEFDDTLICGACLQTETIRCQRCGERIWADDNAGDDDTPLCQGCFDRYYTTCEDCGRVILQDDAYYVSDDDYEARCYSCHCRRRDNQYIHDYYYKPEPIFFGESSRYFGVELEIDGAGESEHNAQTLCKIANRHGEMVYIKHDGSLDDGMELVTHPMTMEYHLKEMPWCEVLTKAKELGYLSHKAGTCGLHIHVNRSAFGETEAEQDECIARVLYFFEKHWEELLKFSRRTRNQLERWAARYGLKEHPKDILDHAKGDLERYSCVNLCNTATNEIRLLRGSLVYNTVLAAIELVDRICDVALYLSDEEIKAMSWTTFVSGCSHLPELVQYLKERRLYVNEPVTTEAEV